MESTLGTKRSLSAAGARSGGVSSSDESLSPPAASSLHEVALASRPGVVRMGFLQKEGPHTLSRAFPSKRFFVALSNGRLEYYEERTVKLQQKTAGALSDNVSLNEWNLVVYVSSFLLEQSSSALCIGDVLVACDGVALTGEDVLLAAVGDGSRPRTLTLLRPKGEVPVVNSICDRIGDTRLRITVSREHEMVSRPPFVLIATDATARDEWLDSVQAAARAGEADAHASATSSVRSVETT